MDSKFRRDETGIFRTSLQLLSIPLLFWVSSVISATPKGSVSFDGKAMIIDGKKRILFSGSIHYPRSTPDMWPGLIQKAKDGGLHVVETYVFWNVHEPLPGQFNFEGRYDLVNFIKLVKEAGLYAALRIGPYVCAEWNYGGLPPWLRFKKNMEFRTDNEAFKNAMQYFTKKIVNMTKANKLFYHQGGPIILAQIENEYQLVEKRYGLGGQAYAKWAAKMALGLNIGVPWIMCKQDNAPDKVINTCNGFYCDWFTPNSPFKPKMWSELWTAWYQPYEGLVPHRPVQDVAFAAARFLMTNGSYINYYMYHGGTNFGRTSGGPFITTSYDYDAPLDEYGLIRQPKWGHLKDLHRAIQKCEGALVSSDANKIDLGKYSQAYVFNSSKVCAAFLSNYDSKKAVTVTFNGEQYTIPRWSASILPDCKTVTFNTAIVTANSSKIEMRGEAGERLSWSIFDEKVPSFPDGQQHKGLWEQKFVTKDQSDYLWYLTKVTVNANDLKQDPVLSVTSAGHGLHVFINGEWSGSQYGNKGTPSLTFQTKVNLKPGTNNISILSVAVGLQNIGFKYEDAKVGIDGPVRLNLYGRTMDLTNLMWSYKVGLEGEDQYIYTQKGQRSVRWADISSADKNKKLRWIKALIRSPDGDEPVAVDMGGMTKGQAWINENHIGRYWTSSTLRGPCDSDCNYSGTYRPNKCADYCGSGNWSHVPRSFLQRKWNMLVVFDEMGGDPTKIHLVRRIQTFKPSRSQLNKNKNHFKGA